MPTGVSGGTILGSVVACVDEEGWGAYGWGEGTWGGGVNKVCVIGIAATVNIGQVSTSQSVTLVGLQADGFIGTVQVSGQAVPNVTGFGLVLN